MGRRLFEVWQRTMIRREYPSKCAILFIYSQNDPIPSSASERSPSSALGIALSSLRREIKVSQNWTDSRWWRKRSRSQTYCLSLMWTSGKHTLRADGGVPFPLPEQRADVHCRSVDLHYVTGTPHTRVPVTGSRMPRRMLPLRCRRVRNAISQFTSTMTMISSTRSTGSSQKRTAIRRERSETALHLTVRKVISRKVFPSLRACNVCASAASQLDTFLMCSCL
jgi:hypothetical protein